MKLRDTKVCLIWLLFPLCICVCSLSSAQRHRGPRHNHTLKSASTSQVLSDGSRLDLIAVTDSKLRKAWKADGSPISISDASFTATDLSGLTGKQILMRLTVPKAHRRSDYFPIVETAEGPAIIRVHRDNKNVFDCLGGLHVLPGDLRTEFQVRVATEEFKMAELCVFKNERRVSGFTFGDHLESYKTPRPSAVHNESTKPEFKSITFDPFFKVDYIIPPRFKRDDLWFAAKDRQGKSFENAGVYPEEHRVAFKGEASKVAQLELLVRPITKVSFATVILKR